MSSVHSSSLQMLLAKELDEILYLMLGIDFESWIRYFSGPKICSLVSDQQLISHFTRSSPTFDYFLSLFSCMSMTCIFEHPLRSQYIKWKDFETATQLVLIPDIISLLSYCHTFRPKSQFNRFDYNFVSSHLGYHLVLLFCSGQLIYELVAMNFRFLLRLQNFESLFSLFMHTTLANSTHLTCM